MGSTVMVVEDEVKVRDIVKVYLEREGYKVLAAADGEAAVAFAERYRPDVVILDMMLPKKSGAEVCTEIRRYSDAPIIILTARNSEDDKIEGLDLGADDYMVKPFSPRELMARVRAALRRVNRYALESELLIINNGELTIDLRERRIRVRGRIVDLTATEFELLVLMSRNPGVALSRTLIVEKVLGMDYEGYDRTIDSHIKNLRQKIESNPSSPDLIQTVFKVGYRFDAKVEKSRSDRQDDADPSDPVAF